MIISKKTLLNILLIAFVLAFFVTPLGHFGKVFLNQIFAGTPVIIEESSRQQLQSYNWKLKDPNWDYFNLDRSKGKVLFVNFWASWRLPCEAELKGIQKLYNDYGDKVDFYIITNEEKAPVEEFMRLKKFDFPLTYLIIGEPAPFEILEPPASYIIDKNGFIVVKEKDIASWDTGKIRELLDNLIK
ncbi:TlpA family protein disulfide reductase [Maribacter sp. HTCC2170]|uniref:TlpA family protein disulfide reductase n=1 Tax=Maribacter sp. (strain HTCC2170 / KCCM 42371) TaxID=313603 RepID=UPI0003142A72|nr:TlpA disulfide reductase family protein [Maribacter sp. HTCC2170]